MKCVLVSTLLLVCCGVQCLHLPEYIKPCARKDPNFNACAKKSAIAALPKFVYGDPKYKIPPLEPMLISELHIEQGTKTVGLILTAQNATMSGLKDVDIKEIRYDSDKHHVEYDWFFPKLVIDCTYNVSGKILLLPIFGHGPGTFTVNKVNATYIYEYTLVTRKGKRYAIPNKDQKLLFQPKGMTVKLQNLFNGDKFLGENMNRFINENWEEILKDVGPAIAEAMGEFIRQVLTNIFTLIPYDEAVPESVPSE